MYKLLLVSCFIFLPFLVFSQARGRKISPDKRHLPPKWEVYYTQIPVSGGVRVGAMAFENREKILPSSFFIKIPKHTFSTLCIEISSRDGRYQAKLPYSISGLDAGIYEFDLPTQYQDQLRNYTVKDITILAKIAKDCDIDPECYVLSAWNRPIFDSQQAYIYLNSEDNTELILANPSRSSAEYVIECEKIAETVTTSYNCLCKISGYDLTKFPVIRIKRIVFRGPVQSFSFLEFPIRF